MGIFKGRHKQVMSPDAYARAKASGNLPDLYVMGGESDDPSFASLGPDLEALMHVERPAGMSRETAARIVAEVDAGEGY